MTKRKRLTYEEARRAIYLDFEGRKGEPPVLLGTLWASRQDREPSFRQYLLDPSFCVPLQPGSSRTTLAGELRSLLDRVERQHRVLVGWSEHEIGKVELVCPELAEEFAARYRNARKVASAWWTNSHPGERVKKDDRGRKHTLSRYAPLVGYEQRNGTAGGDVGDTIKEVRQALERKGSCFAISPKLQQRWDNVLIHNEWDCRATREICLQLLERHKNQQVS